MERWPHMRETNLVYCLGMEVPDVWLKRSREHLLSHVATPDPFREYYIKWAKLAIEDYEEVKLTRLILGVD